MSDAFISPMPKETVNSPPPKNKKEPGTKGHMTPFV
jgi:hypothetical protein